MRTNDIYFLLALANLALIGYIHIRRYRLGRMERMVRSLRHALEHDCRAETRSGGLALEHAS